MTTNRSPRILLLSLAGSLLLSGCQMGPKDTATRDLINAELARASEAREESATVPAAVTQALLSATDAPAGAAPTAASRTPAEPRFDLAVNNAPAAQVFMAIVSGTRYSMLVHPDVSGTVTLNVKDVTVPEALDSIRELYGYEYKVQGNRISIQPLTMQSRIYHVNYLTANRAGRSDTRISSGSIVSNNGTGGASASPAAAPTSSNATTVPPTAGGGTNVSTVNQSDLWTEIADALKAIVGTEGGRSVVISPQSGLIIVRAMPAEHREVAEYLKASQLSVDRQVMLEAKIVEVVLKDGAQSGINWGAFDKFGNHRLSSGINSNQIHLQSPSLGVQSGTIVNPYNTDASTFVANTLGAVLPSPMSGAMGLAFTSGSFAAMLSFLDTQGTTHVLSSPRIATLNNQKAVLKVGTDDFFVTNITTTTTSSGSGSTTSPTITVQPFFSGISLDVTPQIDEDGFIILHIRPSVSVVSEKNKSINLGTLGTYTLPLASSNMNETDSIVRVRDGNLVAIGGLMEQAQSNDSSKVPGVGDIPVVDQFFKQRQKSMQKREFVVLLKPTIIQGDKQWQNELDSVRNRLQGLDQMPGTP